MAEEVDANANGDKPAVLIIGGLGFIGRFLAKYIHDNHLASHLRIVDKVLPQLAYLAPEFQESCASDNFLQADASREPSLQRIFEPPPDRDHWDYVFNLGGETALSQTHEIYKLRSYDLSMTLGQAAAKHKVKAFVEASTGMVYAPTRAAKKENDKLKPWLKLSKAKLQTEADLSKIEGLHLIILRLAHVYGEYDNGYIAKALCMGRVYKELDRELKWLWTQDLRINTVHVLDAVRALWTAAEYRAKLPPSTSDSTTPAASSPTITRRTSFSTSSKIEGPLPSTPVFNIVDHGATSQGTLATLISDAFSIKTGFQGQLISQFAKLNLDHVVDDLNEDILTPWAEMLKTRSITTSRLSPFLEKELLKERDLSIDGSEFENKTGFKYERERFDAQGLQEMVDSYQRMGWWP